MCLVAFLGYKAGVWSLLTMLTLPIFVVKQPINLLILKVGCESIADADVKKRAMLRKE